MDRRPGVRHRRPAKPTAIPEYSFGALALGFIAVSAADLIATLRGLTMQGTGYVISEDNPIADVYLKQFGLPGMVGFKAALVGIVLLSMWMVYRQNPILARVVMWIATVGMGFLALYHISLIVKIFG